MFQRRRVAPGSDETAKTQHGLVERSRARHIKLLHFRSPEHVECVQN